MLFSCHSNHLRTHATSTNVVLAVVLVAIVCVLASCSDAGGINAPRRIDTVAVFDVYDTVDVSATASVATSFNSVVATIDRVNTTQVKLLKKDGVAKRLSVDVDVVFASDTSALQLRRLRVYGKSFAIDSSARITGGAPGDSTNAWAVYSFERRTDSAVERRDSTTQTATIRYTGRGFPDSLNNFVITITEKNATITIDTIRIPFPAIGPEDPDGTADVEYWTVTINRVVVQQITAVEFDTRSTVAFRPAWAAVKDGLTGLVRYSLLLDSAGLGAAVNSIGNVVVDMSISF